MFGTHDLPLFALAVLVVNATPGVDMMFTLTRTLQQGVRGGLAAALGIATGCVLHTAAAAFGLATLLASSSAAFAVVKWLGAAYLLWLAIGLWRDAARPTPAPGNVGAVGVAPASAGSSAVLRRTYAQALLTNVLNPKIAIFFLALLPQFIDATAVHKALAFGFLGVWFILQSLLFLSALTLLVAPLRRRRPGASWLRAAQAVGGVLFAGLAARLLLAERA